MTSWWVAQRNGVGDPVLHYVDPSQRGATLEAIAKGILLSERTGSLSDPDQARILFTDIDTGQRVWVEATLTAERIVEKKEEPAKEPQYFIHLNRTYMAGALEHKIGPFGSLIFHNDHIRDEHGNTVLSIAKNKDGEFIQHSRRGGISWSSNDLSIWLYDTFYITTE
jgi:hypothetical protein